MRPNRLGDLGETLAARHLAREGWEVTERTGRYAHYDLTIERGSERWLVEVKTKRLTGTAEDRRHDIRPEGWRYWTEEAPGPVRFLIVWIRNDRWDATHRRLEDFRVTRAPSGRWKLVDRGEPPRRLRYRLASALPGR